VRNEGFDIDILQAMITHHGQPTADTSAVPTFMVSRLARQFVKVVLSGDGGDECFGGYTHFGWAQDIDRLYAVPRPVRGAGAVLLRRLAHSKLLSQAGALRQGLNSLDVALADRSQVPLEVLRLNDGAAIDAILTPEWCREHDDRPTCLETFLSDLPPGDPVRQSQEFAFRYVLPDAYLAKVDRMSMASALEVRVPFLDHRLVEFCLSLPGHVHWRHGKGKNLLRRAAADLLPPEIFAHRKQGFGIPLHRWANDEYFELAEELLGAESVRRRGVFRPQAVKELLDRAQGRTPSGNALESTYRLSHRLFMLVGFEMWCRLLIDNLVDSPSCTARWESQVDEESSVG